MDQAQPERPTLTESRPRFASASDSASFCCAYARYYELSLKRCPYRRNQAHQIAERVA